MTQNGEAKGAKFAVEVGIGREGGGNSIMTIKSKNTKKNDTQSNGNQKTPVVMIP
jgi:hypothetical protein